MWCCARSPEASLMIARIWSQVRRVRSSRSWVGAMRGASATRTSAAAARTSRFMRRSCGAPCLHGAAIVGGDIRRDECYVPRRSERWRARAPRSRRDARGQLLPDRLPVHVEPAQHFGDAPGRERHARVRGPLVEIDRVAVGTNGVAARKRHVADVAVALVLGLGTEHPFVTTEEAG